MSTWMLVITVASPLGGVYSFTMLLLEKNPNGCE